MVLSLRSPQKRHLHPLDISIVLHPLRLGLTFSHYPQPHSKAPSPLLLGLHCVLEDYVLLQKDSQTCRPGRNIVTLLTRSVASLSECLDAPVNRQHHSQSPGLALTGWRLCCKVETAQMLTPPTSALVQLTMPPHTVLLHQTRLCCPCSSLSSAVLSPEHSVYQYFLFCSAGTEFHQESTPPHHEHGPLKNSAVPFRAAFAKGIFKNLPMFSESLNWNLHSCKKTD